MISISRHELAQMLKEMTAVSKFGSLVINISKMKIVNTSEEDIKCKIPNWSSVRRPQSGSFGNFKAEIASDGIGQTKLEKFEGVAQ